ncbi:hypothetical protein TEU_06805 [Thermococcus eurythermalis]|uniref:Uncharacterized protein n=1 Tax=Thermococcus eurythermalis TaxID=1505907 RepID=A0A097QUC9_9EURY|nr:hypothetical protein [Thermococcus eurythermalis]AIU70059.1 hypothetical protein TEU_06805 [Thermococcus eurythermalis]
MKELFSAEGVFIEYSEKEVEIRPGDKLVHRSETPTELWWKLKEAVKGKKVRVVVYEVEE